MKKSPVVSVQAQRAVADVLTKLMFCEDLSEVSKVWDDVFSQYHLHRDPFTGCPVCTKDYSELKRDYDRQGMIEKYGHFDGLD